MRGCAATTRDNPFVDLVGSLSRALKDYARLRFAEIDMAKVVPATRVYHGSADPRCALLTTSARALGALVHEVAAPGHHVAFDTNHLHVQLVPAGR